MQGLLSLYLMLTAVFFFVQLVIPGNFAAQFAYVMPAPQMAALRAELGLGFPVWLQYVFWMRGLLRLDLARSFNTGAPVADLIVERGMATLLVFATGLIIAYIIGLWLGRVTAWKGPNTFTDMTTFVLVTFYAIFPPALAYILYRIFSVELRLFPISQDIFSRVFRRMFGVSPFHYMPDLVLSLIVVGVLVAVVDGFIVRKQFGLRVHPLIYLPVILALWVLSWRVMGIWTEALWLAWASAIPVIAFVVLSVGEIMIVSRTSMAETLHEDYIQTARAKGLPENLIRDKHAGRNSLLPVLSKLVIGIPYLMAGLAIIEFALGWPGMGATAFNAAINQDYPVLMGSLAVIGLITLGCRITLETLYAIIDPRIRR